MPDIFGVDIAGKINKALGNLVFDLTLHKQAAGTRTALTGGTNPVDTDHSGKGFVSDYRDTQVDGTIVQRGDRKTIILGASLPTGVVPVAGDRVTIEGVERTIINVERDPAGATYVLQSRS